MRHFSKEIKNWPLKNNEQLNLTKIESKGKDLKDLLSNAVIYLADWHGNAGYEMELDDLSVTDYDAIVELFAEFLAGA